MPRSDRAFLYLLGAVAAVQLALFLYYVEASRVFGLFYDMADWLLQYARYLSDGDLLGFLWSPHAEDRVATTRLVLLADIKLFGGISYPFIVVSLCSVVLVAAVLLNAIRTAGPFDTPAGIASFLVAMLLFNPALGVACSVPVYDNYPHVVGLAALALHFFDDAGRSDRAAFLRRLIALLAGIGAGLASAAGLLIWPILLWVAWRGRLSARWIAATTICGTVYVALYLHGNRLLRHTADLAGSDTLLSADKLRIIGTYFVRYMGLPWSHDPGLQLPAEAIGALLTVLIVALAIRRGFFDPPNGAAERVEVGLLVFVLGTAVLASFGRVDLVDPGWTIYPPAKYAIFLSVAHAALAASALPWLRRWWERPERRGTLRIACLLIGGLLIAQQIGLGQAAAAKAARLNATISKFMAGGRDAEMPGIVHTKNGFADRALQFMRTAEIYDFRR